VTKIVSGSIFEKYLAKKKKDIFNYVQHLEKIIEVENNALWTNQKTFSDLAKKVIDNYVDNYYLNTNYYDNPIEYLKKLNKTILLCISTSCEKDNSLEIIQNYPREVFLLTILICVASYIDKSSNAITGDYKVTKYKFKNLLKDLENINNTKIRNDNKTIQQLFMLVKKSNITETKFFNEFMVTNSYNQYITYTNRPLYYLIKYHYSIPSLYEYNSRLVKKVNNEFEDEYASISIDLLNVQILKELVGNNAVYNYLIPISYLKKSSALKNVNNKYLKEHINVLVDFKVINENEELIKKIEDIGLSVVYDCSEIENINVEALKAEMTVIINNKFKKNNEENFEQWKNMNIKFILKNKEEEL